MDRSVFIQVFKDSSKEELITSRTVLDGGITVDGIDRPTTDDELISFFREQLRIQHGADVDTFHYVVE